MDGVRGVDALRNREAVYEPSGGGATNPALFMPRIVEYYATIRAAATL